MKNVLSTLLLLSVIGILAIGGWVLYSSFASTVKQPLNAWKQVDGMLAAEVQQKMWVSEHLSMEIEKRFGAAFLKAYSQRSIPEMRKLMNGQFGKYTQAQIDWKTVSGPPFREDLRITGDLDEDPSVVEQEFFDIIFAPIADIKIDQLEFRVLRTYPIDSREGLRQCISTVQLVISGIDETGATGSLNRKTYRHQAKLFFRFEDEKNFGKFNSLLSWSPLEERLTVCPEQLMEEATASSNLDKLQLSDHLGSTEIQGERLQNFQFAVEDFDVDGDYDIAVVDLAGNLKILACENGIFEDVASAVGVEKQDAMEMPASSAAWIDFNNDGYPDLVAGSRLFENENGKKLVDVTSKSGLDIDSRTIGVSVIDFDNDGYTDLYLVNRALGSELNADSGWLGRPDQGEPNRLFKNNGDGSFSDVTESSNTGGGAAQSNAAVWFFHDEDNFPDLYVANEFGKDVLLRNVAGERFEDASEELGASIDGRSFGAAAGDLNNDGKSDLCVAGRTSVEGRRVTKEIKSEHYQEQGLFERVQGLCAGNRLGLQGADGKFEQQAEAAGVKHTGWAWSPTMLDINSDGLLDLYWTTGYQSVDAQQPDSLASYWKVIATQPTDRRAELPQLGELDSEVGEVWESPYDWENKNLAAFQPNKLFVNVDGGKSFSDVSLACSASINADSRSAVAADFDGDGSVDLLVGSIGGEHGNSLRLFLNQIKQNNRLEIRLQGVKSNRLGIGARIIAEVGESKIVRDLIPQNGFMGLGQANVWLGLGDSKTIQRLSIQWPSGQTQVLENVAGNRSLRITEGSSEIETLKSWE